MALLKHRNIPFPGSGRETPRPTGAHRAGAMLRDRREAIGIELSQAAAALRIKQPFLAALEAGELDRLPGPAYAAGFLRAYTDYLGLDSEEALRRFKAEADGLDAKPDLSFPVSPDARSMPGRRLLLVALILAFCGYSGWYYLSIRQAWRGERVGPVPPALLRAKRVSSAPRPAHKPTSTPSPHLLSAADAAPAGESAPFPPASRAALGTAGRAGPINSLRGGARQTRAAGTNASGAPPASIVIRATAKSWIEVRDSANTVVIERVLRPGDSYRVPNRPGLTLWTGNAGGLTVTVGGKSAPSLGRNGAVRRDIALQPEALMASSAGK